MERPEPATFLTYANFESPDKAALAASPLFRRADAWIRGLAAAALSFHPELLVGCLGSRNDSPSSPELERLTRDFFSFEILAFAQHSGARLRAEVRFDPSAGGFRIRDRRWLPCLRPREQEVKRRRSR